MACITGQKQANVTATINNGSVRIHLIVTYDTNDCSNIFLDHTGEKGYNVPDDAYFSDIDFYANDNWIWGGCPVVNNSDWKNLYFNQTEPWGDYYVAGWLNSGVLSECGNRLESFLEDQYSVRCFVLLPWYIAPIGAGNDVLRGPTGRAIATLPTLAAPDVLGWISILLFWILALLILCELGSAIFAFQRERAVQIGRIYQVSGQLGLALAGIILILTLVGLVPGLGWRGVLLTFGGIGFWLCVLGFFMLRQAGVSLQRR